MLKRFVLVMASIAIVVVAGCNQGTSSVTQEKQAQGQVQRTEQTEKQATYGGHKYEQKIRVTDGVPWGGELPTDLDSSGIALVKAMMASLEWSNVDGRSMKLFHPSADNIQIITQYFNTAATTTPTSSQTGGTTATGTQEGTTSSGQEAKYTNENTLSAQGNLAQPGGAVSANQATASRGSTITLSAEQEQRLATQMIQRMEPTMKQFVQDSLAALIAKSQEGGGGSGDTPTPTPSPDTE